MTSLNNRTPWPFNKEQSWGFNQSTGHQSQPNPLSSWRNSSAGPELEVQKLSPRMFSSSLGSGGLLSELVSLTLWSPDIGMKIECDRCGTPASLFRERPGSLAEERMWRSEWLGGHGWKWSSEFICVQVESESMKLIPREKVYSVRRKGLKVRPGGIQYKVVSKRRRNC